MCKHEISLYILHYSLLHYSMLVYTILDCAIHHELACEIMDYSTSIPECALYQPFWILTKNHIRPVRILHNPCMAHTTQWLSRGRKHAANNEGLDPSLKRSRTLTRTLEMQGRYHTPERHNTKSKSYTPNRRCFGAWVKQALSLDFCNLYSESLYTHLKLRPDISGKPRRKTPFKKGT